MNLRRHPEQTAAKIRDLCDQIDEHPDLLAFTLNALRNVATALETVPPTLD